MKKEENPRLKRIHAVYGISFLAMFGLVLRLGELQIVKGANYRAVASRVSYSKLPILPQRGWIYDRYMNLLAYNVPSFSIVLTRLQIPNQNFAQIASLLAPVLRLPRADLLEIMKHKDEGEARVKLYENADTRQISYITEHQSLLPGVQCVEDTQREYPNGDLAGHILGYIQPQPAEEEEYYKNLKYIPEQKVGITGVENQYEHSLQGHVGYNIWLVNNQGIPVKNLGVDPAPEAGNSIQLTVDGPLQAQAQQLVMDELYQSHHLKHSTAKDAEAVILDVKTGGVLALVSYPYYDPNWFTHSWAYQQHQKYINNTVLTPMINHVLASPRYPGSTVKPINILAGLESGVISGFTKIFDPGVIKVGTYDAHDWNLYGHGMVDAIKAIQVSCDTYMYELGMRLCNWHDGPPAGKSFMQWYKSDRVKGLNTLFSWEFKFGLGPKTGIDLPGEATGRFYTDDSIHHTIKKYDLLAAEKQIHENGYYIENHGLLYDNAFAAIGQMQEFTPMQLAVSIMTIANDGVKLCPHVLQAILTPDGKSVVHPITRIVADHLQISANHMMIVKRGLYNAVNRPGGTAYRIFKDAPYRACGKTGTAEVSQYGKKTDISLFVGYAPADHPQVCVAVMVPGAGESSDAAVPLARKLLDAYFRDQHQYFSPDTYPKSNQIPVSWRSSRAYFVPEISS